MAGGKWRVEKGPGYWVAGDGTLIVCFPTWREAFHYADDQARYDHLERQWLKGVAESRGSNRRPMGWRS